MQSKIFELQIILNDQPELIEIMVNSINTIDDAIEDIESDFKNVSVQDYSFVCLDFIDSTSIFKRKSYLNISGVKLSISKTAKIKRQAKAA